MQTFFGHANAVNKARFNNSGELIASGDCDGVVKVWDVRMASRMANNSIK